MMGGSADAGALMLRFAERTGLTSDGAIIGRHVQKASSQFAAKLRSGAAGGSASGEVG